MNQELENGLDEINQNINEDVDTMLSSNQTINVILIDDHKMVREGIKQLLEIDGEIKVIGCADDGIEGLKLLDEVNPDVILLDINMPNMNGISFLTKLKQTGIKRKVLVLTIHNEIEYLYKALDNNVSGYVLKDSELDVLKDAINTVYNGGKYYQKELAPLIKDYKENENVDNLASLLSEREIQVLCLVAKGYLNRDIGEKLEITEKTVKNHVSKIFKKIKVTDRTQAAVFAIKNNLVEI